MARTRAQNGTEKDFQEGIKIESSKQEKTGKAKKEPEKTLEGDFKNMKLTWGTAEREAKEINSRKRSGCIILRS